MLQRYWQLCCYIITEDFYEDIANDVERWFDTFNCDKNDKRPLPIGINKTVIGLFKDELGGNIMKEFWRIRAKTYTYLLDVNSEYKKAKGTKKCIIKKDSWLRIITFVCLTINHSKITTKI